MIIKQNTELPRPTTLKYYVDAAPNNEKYIIPLYIADNPDANGPSSALYNGKDIFS